MRPPFAYYGGKTALAARIVDLMAAHRVHIEPFFVSGAVLFAKGEVGCEIVNDRDGGLVAFFWVLRDPPEDLERVCRLTPYARAEYAAADLDTPGVDELERARRFWVRVNHSFAKTAGRRRGWSVTTERTQSVAVSVGGRIDRFTRCAQRLGRVVVEHCDGAGLIDRLATADTVVLCRPALPGQHPNPRVAAQAGRLPLRHGHPRRPRPPRRGPPRHAGHGHRFRLPQSPLRPPLRRLVAPAHPRQGPRIQRRHRRTRRTDRGPVVEP